MTAPTIEAMYAELHVAKLNLRQCDSSLERIKWRNEIGRLTQAIRRAGMAEAEGRQT